jgi:hypothetical protein
MNYDFTRSLISELQAKGMRARNAYWPRYVFIHINKTAGSSIERALGLKFEHKTARQKCMELGELRWQRAFKFSFVRNPWDKVVSHYHFRVKTNQTGMGDGHIGFSDWVRAAYHERDPRYYDQPKMFAPQTEWLTDDSGKLIVDFIGRFETLNSDIASIQRILQRTIALPHLKSSPHTNFGSYYDDASWAIVASHFNRDCTLFGY